MGETLQMASEKGAYTLTDEGTYLSYKSNLKLDTTHHQRRKPAQHLQRHDRVQ